MNDAAVAQKHDGTEYLTMMSMKAVFGVERTDRHGCNILRGGWGGWVLTSALALKGTIAFGTVVQRFLSPP